MGKLYVEDSHEPSSSVFRTEEARSRSPSHERESNHLERRDHSLRSDVYPEQSGDTRDRRRSGQDFDPNLKHGSHGDRRVPGVAEAAGISWVKISKAAREAKGLDERTGKKIKKKKEKAKSDSSSSLSDSSSSSS